MTDCQKGGCSKKRGIILQWHITHRCNLRCIHCYQETFRGRDLSLQQLLEILEQFRELVEYGKERYGWLKGHINITGGEPFAHRNFLELLEVFHQQEWLSFGILTNGSFIDRTMARRLRELSPSYVQVSLEGGEKVHNRIRGEGNFARTLEAIRNLQAAGVRTMIAFTAHAQNYKEFPAVARVGVELRVAKVWADRMIPWGQGASQHVLSPEQTQEFFQLMFQARKEAQNSQTQISMHRALQFLEGGQWPYYCTAGDTLITVMPQGEVYPCRRMPIEVGNAFQNPLLELYRSHSLLQKLRDKKNISSGCEGCRYNPLCRGGLKCLSYALTGNPFVRDPGCWLENTTSI
ncbi:MAG: radical SAM protein [Planctomycetota bacterium]|nr:MAG: radical SAM protein [Planctomycetota bacterium]